jgi:hypothetical protein
MCSMFTIAGGVVAVAVIPLICALLAAFVLLTGVAFRAWSMRMQGPVEDQTSGERKFRRAA